METLTKPTTDMMISSESHFDPEGVEFHVTTVPEGVDIYEIEDMIDGRDVEGTMFTDVVVTVDKEQREITHFYPFQTQIS